MQRRTNQWVARGFWVSLLLGMVLVAGWSGCTRVVVYRPAPNDPLWGQRSFAVEPLNFTNLQVGRKTEEAYLAGKDAKSVASFHTDKTESAQFFGGALRAAAPGLQIVDAGSYPAPFTLRPTVRFWEPGFYAYFAARPAEMVVLLQIFDAQGQLIDQREFRGAIDSRRTLSSGNRMRQAAEQAAWQMGQYLSRRTGVR